ncbi:uncharacterized protein V6R79_023808, partial [Siganus canaliculatus]
QHSHPHLPSGRPSRALTPTPGDLGFFERPQFDSCTCNNNDDDEDDDDDDAQG